MKNILLTICFAAISITGYSQYYLKSAGLRMGPTTAITYREFIEKDQAYELMISGRNAGLQLTAQYELFTPANISFDDNFVLYYGVGGHLGFERLYPYDLGIVPLNANTADIAYDKKTYLGMGVDALVGIEYRMLIAPLTISLDIKPYFTYLGFRYLQGRFWDTSLSIKYVFND